MRMINNMRILFAILLAYTCNAPAVDLSRPINFLFAADKTANIVDVIDLTNQQGVYRIETDYRIDDLVVTPYAYFLIYTNIENSKAVVYNLKDKKTEKEIDLPIVPRHVVLDTTGGKIGISDSVNGGFVLLSAYTHEITFYLEDLPATTDVLFDPNDIDIYYVNNESGSIGLIDMNTQRTYEIPLTEGGKTSYASPSRSLDGRYVYVADSVSGEVFSLNAYTRKIYNTFRIGDSPVRPYTTPEGYFLYMMDLDTGRFVSVDQNRFEEYADIILRKGINLVAVGRFDRLNLFLSTEHERYYLFDNTARQIIKQRQIQRYASRSAGSD